jgi:hypothetical protein
LDHLKEATFYSPKDLDGLGSQLKECRRYVERGQEEHSPHLLTLLDARIKVCEETLAVLRLNLSHLTPELTPKWDKLVSLLRSLAGCNARSKFPNEEVDAYAKELYELEEELKKDGITAYETTGSTADKLVEMTEKMKLTAAEEDPAPKAETLVSQLLRRNLLWVALIKEKSANPAPERKRRLTVRQARAHQPCVSGRIRQASVDPKQARKAFPHTSMVFARDRSMGLPAPVGSH